jgi:iron(II)-dependent oxidoreductase
MQSTAHDTAAAKMGVARAAQPTAETQAHRRRVDRDAIVREYRRNRARTRALFDLIGEDAYYSCPIPLRHPLVFYEGHLPAFSFNTLIRRALGGASIDAKLEALFARGIDPHELQADRKIDRAAWPDRDAILHFVDEADRRVIAALESAEIERAGHPLLERAEAIFAILEHEVMHQETLRYMCHRLPQHQKRRPAGYSPQTHGPLPAQEWVPVPAGRARLGVAAGSVQFSWDNERPAFEADVGPFAIEKHDTTNAAYLEFVEAGGYRDARWWRDEDWAWIRRESVRHPAFWEQVDGAWHWRGMFDSLPLPLSWPVYVSHAEAHAYARWCGAALPSEAQFQRACYGSERSESRPYPWGEEPPTALRGVFDFESWDPQPAGCHPAGRSAWGIEDLVGNGWEWTSTVFGPFPGFSPLPSYPEYSADFFDGAHMVLKGASPATARELLRPSFRNWFRPRYPYVYATVRCVRETVRP